MEQEESKTCCRFLSNPFRFIDSLIVAMDVLMLILNFVLSGLDDQQQNVEVTKVKLMPD